jgi:thiol peroxidase
MATTALKGNPIHTVGDLPQVGAAAPEFTVTGSDLGEISSADLPGRLVLNAFPSIDTGVCAASVRKFNELAAQLEDTTVLCVSQDLPFAQQRFCGAEGIDNVRVGSSFRSDFGEKLGLTQSDGPMKGLLARAVIVIDADGTVRHSQLVPDISEEPDYDAAVAALG